MKPLQIDFDQLKPVMANPGVETVASRGGSDSIIYSDDLFKLIEGFGIGHGITRDNAVSYIALFRAVSLISGTISGFPLEIVERDGVSPTKAGNRRLDAVKELFDGSPDNMRDCRTWMESCVVDLILDGASVSLIERDSMGLVRSLKQVDATSVQLYRPRNDDGLLYFLSAGSFASDNALQTTSFYGRDILHIPMLNWNRKNNHWGDVTKEMRGVSPLHAVSGAVNIGKEMDKFVRSYFRDGMQADHVFTFPENLTQLQVDEFKAYLAGRNSGDKSRSTLILRHGGDVKRTTAEPSSAQLLESRRYQIEEIGRAFGIPSFMMGLEQKNTSWGTGIESQGRMFLSHSLRPYLERIEAQINTKIMPEGYKIRFNTDDLTRGSDIDRGKYVTELVLAGIITPNEAREREGWAAVEGGNDLQRSMMGMGEQDDAGAQQDKTDNMGGTDDDEGD